MYAETLLAIVCVAQILPTAAPAAAKSESLEVRYARAQLQLAEANLDGINESNKRVAGSAPKSVVAEYQDDVTVAKTRLEQAAAGAAASDFQVWLQRAEAEQRTALATWKIAATVNGHLRGAFEPLDVERFRLRAEIAKLQLARGRALAGAGVEAQLQWKVDLLDNQVQRLKEETRRPTSFVRAYPYWGW